MTEINKTTSTLPSQRSALQQTSWEEITSPGAYVDIGSGDLFRVPQEALMGGASPLIRKQSLGASRLVKVSDDPYVKTMEARMLCAEHNVSVNF